MEFINCVSAVLNIYIYYIQTLLAQAVSRDTQFLQMLISTRYKMTKNLPFQGQFCHTVLEQAKFAVVPCLMSVELFRCMLVLAVQKGSGDRYKKYLWHSKTELIKHNMIKLQAANTRIDLSNQSLLLVCFGFGDKPVT